MIQISFRTQDPNIRWRQYSESASKVTADPRSTMFQNPPIRSIYRTNPQFVPLLKPNPSIREPIHPQPPFSYSCKLRFKTVVVLLVVLWISRALYGRCKSLICHFMRESFQPSIKYYIFMVSRRSMSEQPLPTWRKVQEKRKWLHL